MRYKIDARGELPLADLSTEELLWRKARKLELERQGRMLCAEEASSAAMAGGDRRLGDPMAQLYGAQRNVGLGAESDSKPKGVTFLCSCFRCYSGDLSGERSSSHRITSQKCSRISISWGQTGKDLDIAQTSEPKRRLPAEDLEASVTPGFV